MQDLMTKPVNIDVDFSRVVSPPSRSAPTCRLCGGAGIVQSAAGNKIPCPGCLNKRTDFGVPGASIITK